MPVASSRTSAFRSSRPRTSRRRRVDDLALLVEDVVVLEEVLADVEVVRLDLLLRVADGARDEAVLDRHALLHAEPLHQALHAVGAEDAQQVVLEREVEARASPGRPGGRRGRGAGCRCAGPRAARCRGCGGRRPRSPSRAPRRRSPVLGEDLVDSAPRTPAAPSGAARGSPRRPRRTWRAPPRSAARRRAAPPRTGRRCSSCSALGLDVGVLGAAVRCRAAPRSRRCCRPPPFTRSADLQHREPALVLRAALVELARRLVACRRAVLLPRRQRALVALADLLERRRARRRRRRRRRVEERRSRGLSFALAVARRDRRRASRTAGMSSTELTSLVARAARRDTATARGAGGASR